MGGGNSRAFHRDRAVAALLTSLSATGSTGFALNTIRGICSLASALRSWGAAAYQTQGRIGNIKAQVLLCRGQGATLMENEGINGRSFVQDWLL